MIDKEKLDEVYGRFRNECEIVDVTEANGLLKVEVIPSKTGWGRCTFVFYGKYITCFGDVEPFTWHCTWDTAEMAKAGKCSTNDPAYLTGKLCYKDSLCLLDVTAAKMERIKADIIEYRELEGEDLDEFNEKWEWNQYLLEDVSERNLGGLFEFFMEIGEDDIDEYLDGLMRLPGHYYCAVAMLRCIEDHFAKLNAKENKPDEV